MHDIKVPSVGPKDAKIVVVGEGPGRRELQKGEPFVGKSGETLDSLLSSVGMHRSEVFLTNVVKYYPTNPKERFFFEKGYPTPKYMEGIVELVQELKEVKPNVVVPMGNYALWALTQQMDILKRRGSIYESVTVPGLKVIPSIHPAWYHRGRQWHQFLLTEWDWQRIAEESKTPDICLPSPTIIVDPDRLDIEEAIQRFTNCEMLAFDTEWFAPEKLAYIGFSDDKDYSVVIPATTMQAYRAYKAILGSDVPKITQNGMFDVPALSRIGIDTNNMKHDTMVMFNCCWSDIGKKGLDTLASVFTKHPYYKEDLEFVGQDDEKGQLYCGTDCVVTFEAAEKMLTQEMQPHISGGQKGYDMSILNMGIFLEAAKKGTRCDVELLKKKKEEYIHKAVERERALGAVLGFSINCRSWQQVQKAVYEVLGYGKKRKGRSTDQATLMDIAASETDQDLKDIMTAIVRVRQDKNIVSRYLNEEVVDIDGRIRTNWNLAGTKNGRYSTSDPWWNGLAKQTVPFDARDIFIADPGTVFVGWDLAQAEARLVAVYTRDYDLLDAMDSGADIHIKLAVDLDIFNMTYEEIVAQCEEKGKDKSPPRVLSKVCRHAMNYYLTWYGLKARVNKDYLDTGVGINAALSKLLHERYLNLHTGLTSWWEETYHEMRQKGHLVNDFGRRRNFLGSWSKYDHTHRDGIAFKPQSGIADLTTISINEADKELKKIDPNAQCFAHMHDGGYFQVKEECEDEAKEIIQRVMTKEINTGRDIITIPAEVKSGYNWKDMA